MINTALWTPPVLLSAPRSVRTVHRRASLSAPASNTGGGGLLRRLRTEDRSGPGATVGRKSCVGALVCREVAGHLECLVYMGVLVFMRPAGHPLEEGN